MSSITKFCVFGIVLFGTMLVLHTQIKKSKIYYDKYDCIYHEQLILLDDNDMLTSKVDSLQSVIDSLTIRFQIFDSEPARDMIDIINAIMEVESNGRDNAYNASEDAVGCLQIRQTMVNDVNRILARQGSDLRYTYDCRWDRNKSIEMFNIFIDYYGLTSAEEMARCWNGGPRGINNPYTLGYWNKVEIELEEGYASR